MSEYSNAIQKYLKLELSTQQQYSDDVCNWLQINGAVSITISDNADQPIYEPAPDTMPLWKDVQITALFSEEYLNKKGTTTGIFVESLINQLGYDFSKDVIEKYSYDNIEYDPTSIKNLAFDPISFKDNFWIYPYDKHPDQNNPNESNRKYINLEPGLAFGSGEHPTTTLCLEWLVENLEQAGDVKNSCVIDYGSGSGILGISAVKLGAGSVLAVDNDPQAILATNENARRNNVKEQVAAFLPSELPPVEADYIVANILAQPLVDLAPTIISHLKTGGKLVLSGILEEQSDFVTLAYMQYGISITDIKRKGAWVRIVGEK